MGLNSDSARKERPIGTRRCEDAELRSHVVAGLLSAEKAEAILTPRGVLNQIADRYFKGLCNFPEANGRGISLSHFQSADVCAVHAQPLSDLRLGQPFSQAQRARVRRDHHSNIHAALVGLASDLSRRGLTRCVLARCALMHVTHFFLHRPRSFEPVVRCRDRDHAPAGDQWNLALLMGSWMAEPTAEERARLSGPAMRVFDNVTRCWGLSERMKLQILGYTERDFREWVRKARRLRPLILEVAVLMRISAVLGVFGDLCQLTNGVAGERSWLTRQIAAPPFEGKAPIELLCGSLESQMDVRRHLSACVAG